jgi:hypothetical protein
MSLVAFLADLRSDLVAARASAVQAAMDAQLRGEPPLMFELGEVSVTLEVAHTTSTAVTGKVEAEAKFWVLTSAKVGVEAKGEMSQTGTQTLTLTLTPSFHDEMVDDGTGKKELRRRKPEIGGTLDRDEQLPPPQKPADQ